MLGLFLSQLEKNISELLLLNNCRQISVKPARGLLLFHSHNKQVNVTHLRVRLNILCIIDNVKLSNFLLGIPVEAALTSTLLLRGFTLWLPMLPGLWLAKRELQ